MAHRQEMDQKKYLKTEEHKKFRCQNVHNIGHLTDQMNKILEKIKIKSTCLLLGDN